MWGCPQWRWRPDHRLRRPSHPRTREPPPSVAWPLPSASSGARPHLLPQKVGWWDPRAGRPSAPALRLPTPRREWGGVSRSPQVTSSPASRQLAVPPATLAAAGAGFPVVGSPGLSAAPAPRPPHRRSVPPAATPTSQPGCGRAVGATPQGPRQDGSTLPRTPPRVRPGSGHRRTRVGGGAAAARGPSACRFTFPGRNGLPPPELRAVYPPPPSVNRLANRLRPQKNERWGAR